MVRILALTGRAFVGKSRVSKLVQEIDPRFKKFAFADPLKEEYCRITGIDLETLNENKQKHRPNLISLSKIRKGLNDNNHFEKGFYYADLLMKKIKREEFVVIDDLRFWEELIRVKELGGVVYKVQADPAIRKARGWEPNPDIDNDISETELDLSPYTFWTLTKGGSIFNNDNEDDTYLKTQIQRILSEHFCL